MGTHWWQHRHAGAAAWRRPARRATARQAAGEGPGPAGAMGKNMHSCPFCLHGWLESTYRILVHVHLLYTASQCDRKKTGRGGLWGPELLPWPIHSRIALEHLMALASRLGGAYRLRRWLQAPPRAACGARRAACSAAPGKQQLVFLGTPEVGLARPFACEERVILSAFNRQQASAAAQCTSAAPGWAP